MLGFGLCSEQGAELGNTPSSSGIHYVMHKELAQAGLHIAKIEGR